MAANKFATMLHRNTNKITLVLIYAVLEWTLIILLLLNSLFSHLIIRFTEFFGLKPPCPWCTRVDHVFDRSKKNKNIQRDLLCESHANEVSRLGFCSNHRKLVESQYMCEDCLSSRPESERLFSGKTESGIFLGNDVDDDKVGELSLMKCSCCGVRLLLDSSSGDRLLSLSNVVLETSTWDVLECDQKENMIMNHRLIEGCCDGSSDKKLSDFSGNNVLCDKSVQVCVEEQVSSPQHLEFFLDYTGHKLVPIELVDYITDDNKDDGKIEDDKNEKDQEEFEADSDDVRVEKLEEPNGFLDIDINEVPQDSVMDSMEIEDDENSLVFHHNSMTDEFRRFVDSSVLTRFSLSDAPEDREHDADVSIGTEIPDIDISDELLKRNSVQRSHDELVQKDPCTSSGNDNEADNPGNVQEEEHIVEIRSISVHEKDHSTMDETSFQQTDHLTKVDPSSQETEQTTTNEESFAAELNEIEEDKVLREKHLLLEKRDSGTTELESLDESITSDFENCDEGVITIDRLKTLLRSKRKALQALYTELEEERSASAIAANQTMAMINRLQEEKAAMQMEALQYQRMMEEQSEYDQEALQLLNELMVKREKEIQELERELEACKKRISDYETKEKLKVIRSSKSGSYRSGFSSGSYSNGEDESDGLSVDLEAKEDEGFSGNHNLDHQNATPIDAVLDLEESLADFEDERLSILEQLKVLEEKLFTLDNESEHHFEDVRTIDYLEPENGDHVDENNVKMNGHGHGHTNGKHNHIRKIANQNGKSLLPLFDALNNDEDGVVITTNGNGFHSNGVHDTYESKFEMDSNKITVEEEVDHLYERLQALEADREFLKHCIRSLKKGDKGMELLKEILQHLRDLRNVELRVRNQNDETVM